MMESNADKVSLLVDDELDDCDMSCVIRSMKSEEVARSRWQNYHLIGDAMRGNLPKHIPVGLAERVSRALEHEPVFISPHINASSLVPFRTPSRTKATLGFALAASLSAIAVFGIGVMELNTNTQSTGRISVASSQQPIQTATVSAPQPPAPAVQLAASQDVAKKPMATVLAAADGGNVEQRLQRHSGVAVEDGSTVTPDLYDYLVNYHQYAPGSAGSPDMSFYVQLVGYVPGN